TDGNDEFANRARTNHVIAEKLEAILEPFRQRRQIRCSVLMKEVDPQSRRQLSLVVQREKRKVHGVVVFMCGTIGRRVCRLKRAFVEMSRHTETHAVIQGIDRTTLALLECEQCLPQCQSSATRSLTAGSDGTVGADGNRRILAFKEFLAATVCCRRARESFRDVYRGVGHRLVQFGQPPQTERVIWRFSMSPANTA